MKKLVIIFPLIVSLLACQNTGPKTIDPVDVEEEPIYAMFMANFPRVDYSTPNGNDVRIDNLLFEKQEIEKGKLISMPDTNPVRPYYDFAGWYKEEGCNNPWDFNKDTSDTSVYLYAKWEVAQEEEYVEPEYVYPEDIIEEEEFRITGILNFPVDSGVANLTKGGINRLIENKDDVRFAINYQRNVNITMTSATYDEDESTIIVETSDGNSEEIFVNDITLTMDISKENAGFETKAQGYEEKGKDYENYHILLGGSSSMEYWTSSKEDLDPIVSYNHGIAGSTVQQWTEKLMPRLFVPYSPKAVVYYVGVNNIINSSDDGAKTGNALIELFNKTHEYLPNTQIFYVLINKLPGFLNYQTQFDIANNRAKNFSVLNPWVTCIDAGAGLLKANGKPHYAYFRTDGLHMSEYGYIVWGAAIRKALVNWLG